MYVQIEGVRSIKRPQKIYNLDAIIAVGYRVNSKKATQFRIWAAKILRNYIVNGYAINQNRLIESPESLDGLNDALRARS